MWILTVGFCLIFACAADQYVSSNYYCKDIDRQKRVDISQLEGLWFVKEKIIHTEDRHLRLNLTTCPVLHIGTVEATSGPLYDTYSGPYYGAGYPHTNPNVPNNRNPTDPKTTFNNPQDFWKQMEEYDRRTTYDYDRRKPVHSTYVRQHFGMKHLKIMYMNDGNSASELHMSYNNSNDPGFWMISEPNDDTRSSNFAGTIQVLKAVGNHIMLTVCRPSKEPKELYTMILARDKYALSPWDINNLHGMLAYRGLRTNYIEKTCNKAPSLRGFSLGLLQGLWFVIEKINHTDDVSYVFKKPTCPFIHISEPQEESSTEKRPYSTAMYNIRNKEAIVYTYQAPRMKSLRMYWDEETHSTEYHFHYDINRSGLWTTTRLDEVPDRSRFFGRAHVIKATGSQLVLTFCHFPQNSREVFSVVLSREDHLSLQEIKGIHWLLNREGLKVKAIELSCNGAVWNRISVFILCINLFVYNRF